MKHDIISLDITIKKDRKKKRTKRKKKKDYKDQPILKSESVANKANLINTFQKSKQDLLS